MNHPVLLADDSLTIQKVIKITLANQNYDITECATEDELFHKLPIVQPKIVFLDFNLSERYTGYELTTKIKSILPSTKVLLLLGTFDTVDDAAMEKCGASDKIVKPFDSNKFIAICKQLIDTFADEEIELPQDEEPSTVSAEPEDQWTMNHSTEQKLPPKLDEEPLDDSFPQTMNPLMKEVTDWGMSIPGVIDDTAPHEKVIDLPPIIAEDSPEVSKEAEVTPSAKSDEIKFPENSDLDYPSLEFEEPSEPALPASAPSNVISLNNESSISKIEEQIRDEVEEDLWVADEFEDLKKEVSQKIEEVKNNYQPSLNDFDESLFQPLDEKETQHHHEVQESFVSASTAVDLNSMRGEIEEMVKKYVKEYMDQMFQKNVEKISWEVIPDLPENLIRQELNKISQKVIDQK